MGSRSFLLAFSPVVNVFSKRIAEAKIDPYIDEKILG